MADKVYAIPNVPTPSTPVRIDPEKCIGCRKCIKEIGCPGIVLENGKVCIDPAQCAGCGFCAQLCPAGAIGGGRDE